MLKLKTSFIDVALRLLVDPDRSQARGFPMR
jgi:hypothetical protein